MNYTTDGTGDVSLTNDEEKEKRFHAIEEDLENLIKGLTNISNEYYKLSNNISLFDSNLTGEFDEGNEPIDIMGRLERKVKRLREIRNHLSISLDNLREVF